MTSDEPKLSPLQEKIKELECQSKELSINLTRSQAQVIADESTLLKCLQQLMTLQNSYIGGL